MRSWWLRCASTTTSRLRTRLATWMHSSSRCVRRTCWRVDAPEPPSGDAARGMVDGARRAARGARARARPARRGDGHAAARPRASRPSRARRERGAAAPRRHVPGARARTPGVGGGAWAVARSRDRRHVAARRVQGARVARERARIAGVRGADAPRSARLFLVAGAVPEALAAVSASLRCPNCSQPLAAAEGALGCPSGHSFDVARDGHVTLTDPRRRPATGDDAEMVASRATVLDAGHFAPLAGALVQAAPQSARLVLDVGAGTGHYLAAVLDALPAARGIAADASRPALRRAARANPRIAAIACDVWQR